MIIAQLSDPHISIGEKSELELIDTRELLSIAVKSIAGLKPHPDTVIITGDLTNHGLLEEYELLRKILVPILERTFIVPGNHDNPNAIRNVFHDQWYLNGQSEYLDYSINRLPIRLIGMDTSIPNEEGGEIRAAQLNWLDRELDKNARIPTILFQHHPPFATGIKAMDKIGCKNGDQLGQIISKRKNIIRLLCGHQHRTIQLKWNNVHCCISPSTAYQIRLSFLHDPLYSYTLEPPGFLLHYLTNGHDLVTHVVYTDNYPGSFKSR